LACGDQRRLTGNGSTLEVVLHDYALYKSTFTLLYFTLPHTQAAQVRITQCFTCKLYRTCLYLVSVHQMAPPQTEVADI